MVELGLATSPGDTALVALQRRIASAGGTAEDAARAAARAARAAAPQPPVMLGHCEVTNDPSVGFRFQVTPILHTPWA